MRKTILFGLLLVALAFAQISSSAIEESTATPHTSQAEDPWWKRPCPTPPIDDSPNPLHANKTHFLAWVKKHAKNYKPSEIPHRFSNWMKSVKKIWEINHRQNNTWFAALNPLSAHTKEEFKNMLGAKTSTPPNATVQASSSRKRFRPSWIDWTQKGTITPVKDQGQCGCCWAFSAAAALEGSRWTYGRGWGNLSPQQIIDCAGLGACGGGDPMAAIRWGGRDGMSSFEDYPYHANQGGCYGRNKQIHCNNIQASWSGNDDDAANIIADGPASICFHVQDDFMHYGGGVYGGNCPHDINHAVLAVGYAENCNNSGRNCYILKNQWGVGWGTGGYFLMEMGSNMCGIAGYVARPTECW